MHTIREAVVDIHDLLSDARVAANSHEAGRPTHDAEAMAGMALTLAALHDEILDALEPLKEALRAEAMKKAAGDPLEGGLVVRLNGVTPRGATPNGHVTVTFPDPDVRMAKNCDESRLRKVLGPNFRDWFQEKTSLQPARGFQERVASALKAANPALSAEARVAMSEVEVKEATPRVGFKPLPLR